MIATTYHGACSECGAQLATTKPAETCSGSCRVRRFRRHRRADADARRAASEAAFASLLAHGAEIRAALAEGRDPDREILAELAEQMDAAAELLSSPSPRAS